MAKGQIHLGPNGPSKCSAQSDDSCPFGGSGHFDSALEAEAAYAKVMENEGFEATGGRREAAVDEDDREDFVSNLAESRLSASQGGRYDDPDGLRSSEELDAFKSMIEKNIYGYRFNTNRVERINRAIEKMKKTVNDPNYDGSGSMEGLSQIERITIEKSADELNAAIYFDARNQGNLLADQIVDSQRTRQEKLRARAETTSAIASNVATIQAGGAPKSSRIQAPNPEVDKEIAEMMTQARYSKDGNLARTKAQQRAISNLQHPGYENLTPGRKNAAVAAVSGVEIDLLKSEYSYSPTTVRELNQLKREALEASRSKDFAKQMEVARKINSFAEDNADKLERREKLRQGRQRKIYRASLVPVDNTGHIGRVEANRASANAKILSSDRHDVKNALSNFPVGTRGWNSTLDEIKKGSARGDLYTNGLKITSKGVTQPADGSFVFKINGSNSVTNKMFIVKKNRQGIWGQPEEFS